MTGSKGRDNNDNDWKAEVTNSTSQINTTWLKYFISNSGIVHLFNIMNSFESSLFNSTLVYQCIDEIVDIIQKVELLNIKTSEICPDKQKTIDKLIEIIYYIMEASFNKDNDFVLISLQKDHTKRREREILVRSNKKETEEEAPLMDELHDKIKANYNLEETTIELIINFMKVIEDQGLIENLIIKNIFIKKILTFGFICPKNHKMKMVFINFMTSHLKEIPNRSPYLNEIFAILFDESTLELAKKQSDTSKGFFDIIISLLEEFELNEINIPYNNLTEYMVLYIENYKQDMSDTTFVGFLRILRVFVLNNSQIMDLLVNKHDIINLLIWKSLFSKITSNIISTYFLHLIGQKTTFNPSPKCHSSSSLKAAYQLLSALIYNNEKNLTMLMKVLTEYQK